jgi:Trk K+ transport system NAD-binding subunit
MRSAFAERLVAAIESVTGEFHAKPSSSTIIVGTNARMRLLAAELEAAERQVSLISPDAENLTDSDASAASVLTRAGARTAVAAVAATSRDSVNLTLGRIARDRFHIPLVITRLNLLPDVTSWARIAEDGMVRLTWVEVVSAVLDGAPARDSFVRIACAGDDEFVAEVEMFSPALVGGTIAELQLRGCEAVALKRKDLVMPVSPAVKMCLGDVITLVGSKAAIDQVRGSLTL